MEYRIVYIEDGQRESLDTIYSDYKIALEEMKELANDIFKKEGYTGLLSMEVIGLPSIGAGDYA